MEEGDALLLRDPVQDEPRQVVVHCVHDPVRVADEINRILAGDGGADALEADRGIEGAKGLDAGLDLRPADVRLAVKHLPVEVRPLDRVAIDQGQPADARGREVDRGGGAEPAGARDQDVRRVQPLLALRADGEDLPAIPLPIGRPKARGHLSPSIRRRRVPGSTEDGHPVSELAEYGGTAPDGLLVREPDHVPGSLGWGLKKVPSPVPTVRLPGNAWSRERPGTSTHLSAERVSLR